MSKKKRHIRLKQMAKARGFKVPREIITEEIFEHCYAYPHVPTISEEEMAKYEQSDEHYGCPRCGECGDSDSLIAVTKDEFSMGAAIQYGGNPVSWDELHKCKCGMKFTFNDSNY